HFCLDPEVKEEAVWYGWPRRPSTTCLKRENAVVEVSGPDKSRDRIFNLDVSESVLSQVQHVDRHPEVATIQQEVRGWRFYHHFNSTANSPLRQKQVPTFSPILDHDGLNLTAA